MEQKAIVMVDYCSPQSQFIVTKSLVVVGSAIHEISKTNR